MYTVRAALVSDLPQIYALQDNELREKILINPLPPYDQYISESANKLATGLQDIFLLENEGRLEGFVDFEKSADSWHPTFWSRWLNTLVYVCCEAAFRIRNFPRINWWVRHNNKRMYQICERCGFRKTGDGEFFNIARGFQFIAIGKLTYFELTAEEYEMKTDWIRRQSLPVRFLEQYQTI